MTRGAPTGRVVSGALGAVILALVAVLPAGGHASADLLPPPLPPLPLPPPLGPEPEPDPEPDPRCSTATEPFVPTTVTVPDIDGAVPVIALGRSEDNVPGTAPLTDKGKAVLAFDLDSGVRPGDQLGNALLNAHTYPDGSALGNALLAEVQEGDRLVVDGDHGTICYQVSDRVEVPADSRDATERYFARNGPPQLAIVVCSGERLGPGEWTHRTMWFASPLP